MRDGGSVAARQRKHAAPTAVTRYNLAVSVPVRHRWLLLWIVLGAFVVARATFRDPNKGVLVDHLEFGRRLLHGEDPYAPWRSDLDAPERPLHAPYPPSFGLLTAPFAAIHAALGLRPARSAWALLQIGALIAVARWLGRAQTSPRGPPAPDRHRWLLLGALLLASRFVLRDFAGGGGNTINLALCVLAFAAAENGRGTAAGLLLGLSLATKPTQVWLLPVFLLFGHRRAAWSAVLAGAACVLGSLLLLRVDTGPWVRWLQGSFALATSPDAFAAPALGFPEFEWMNQSLRCAIARWFGEVPPELAQRVRVLPPHGLGLDAGAVAWLARLATAGVLATVLVAARRAGGTAAARATAFAAALVASLLLSPLSWKAHHVALLPLLYLLLRDAVEQRSRGARWLLAAFVATCCLGRDVLGDDLDETANSLYLVTAFDIVALVVACRRAHAMARLDAPAPELCHGAAAGGR